MLGWIYFGGVSIKNDRNSVQDNNRKRLSNSCVNSKTVRSPVALLAFLAIRMDVLPHDAAERDRRDVSVGSYANSPGARRGSPLDYSSGLLCDQACLQDPPCVYSTRSRETNNRRCGGVRSQKVDPFCL